MSERPAPVVHVTPEFAARDLSSRPAHSSGGFWLVVLVCAVLGIIGLIALIGLAGSGPEERTLVLRGERARRLTSHDGRFSTRALFPTDRARRVEFYELRLLPRGREDAEPHPPGTVENLVVQRGSVEIGVSGELHSLDAGDAIQFHADVPHSYRNVGAADAVMYLVMSYPDTMPPSMGWNV